jgi:hypothetical protein
MPKVKRYTPDELENLFFQYREWTKQNPIVITKENYGRLLEVPHTRPTTLKGFYTYCIQYHNSDVTHYFTNSREAYNEYTALCKRIKVQIHSELTDLALVGAIKENLTSKLLGLAEQLNLHGEVKNTIPQMITLTPIYTNYYKPEDHEPKNTL